MSIRDADKAAERQQNQRAAKRSKEAEARPDAMHRAIVFLLRAATENNPDLSEEAKHHLTVLDEQFADPGKIAEMEKPTSPADSAGSQESESAPSVPDTAAAVRQSKRFKRP